jgi:two-component system, CitB family, sensor kinase
LFFLFTSNPPEHPLVSADNNKQTFTMFLKHLKLKSRMILVLGMMALVQTGFIGLFALHYLQQSLDEQIGERAMDVARTISTMPAVINAVQNHDSSFLQPLSLVLAERTHARFVVIGDNNGIRLAHPMAERLGKPMFDDDGDNNATALVDGQSYLSRAQGSLGWSMRAKVPVFSRQLDSIIGVVSVGYHLEQVDATIARYRYTLLLVIGCSLLLSALIAVWFANHFKQAIFGLEPEEVARLVEEQRATLESVREGIIAINADGRITTINHTALETLGLDSNRDYKGEPLLDVVPDSCMIEVLDSGEPRFDQEIWRPDLTLITNRIPMRQGNRVTGVVSSFRRKDEIALLSRKLSHIQQHADSLRAQSHEYSNKLHTIAGLIQIGSTAEALALIGQEAQSHQELISLLREAIPDPILAGCLLGKYNRARELSLNLVIDPDSHMTDIPRHLPREHLVSIIGNLIDNALEATLHHRGTGGEVQVSMTDYGEDLIFEIEDQGPGIEPAQQQAIFERGVSNKTQEGHGIGLHLVKSLLTSLGGSISLESEPGYGSRFVVYIPKQVG